MIYSAFKIKKAQIKMKKYLLLLLVSFLSFETFASNVIRVTRGNADPIPIAINKFAIGNHSDEKIAKEIEEVIANNLKNSGIFRPIQKAAFIENKVGVNHVPLFAAWQQINANLLLNGEVTHQSSGKIRVKVILWDTILEKEMGSETFDLPESMSRRVAHKISDRVYKKITDFDGYFDTKITYVSESGPYLKRKKRLAIMDQDGFNHRYLTDGSDLVLTPRFSPDAKNILYLSYKNRIPQVYLMNLKSGRSSLVGHFRGMSFAPRFSPDGDYAIMSVAKNGSTQIYEINLKSKKVTQLTRGADINTSPSYSPDGRSIVFNSNRDGTRQLYVMNRDGSNKRKISFGGGTYAEPTWSSNDYIAFTKIDRDNGFTIGVMSANTGENNYNERLITSSFLVESPSWAPNGRVLVYTKGSKNNRHSKSLNRIYTIDFTGYNERLIPTPGDASGPEWSRTLQ